MLPVRMLRRGVYLWEQAIRKDLATGTRKEKSCVRSDLVCEIDQMSKIEHPYIVGFLGANIDESTADTMIVLEYMDGGCLQDVLTAQRKNGSPWRPPKATSYSWYAPAPVQWIHFGCGVGLDHKKLPLHPHPPSRGVGTFWSGAADPTSLHAGVRSSAPP